MIWQSGTVFVKEKGAKIVDFSWKKDWDVIFSVLERAIVRFGISIVWEWDLSGDGVIWRSQVGASKGNMRFRAFIVGVGRRGRIDAPGWILLLGLIWISTNASSSNVS